MDETLSTKNQKGSVPYTELSYDLFKNTEQLTKHPWVHNHHKHYSILLTNSKMFTI